MPHSYHVEFDMSTTESILLMVLFMCNIYIYDVQSHVHVFILICTAAMFVLLCISS